jgi:hypothetical protein
MAMPQNPLRNVFKLLIIVGLALASATCASADTIWTLKDVTFTNGNTAVGTFTTNSATNAIISFSLDVTGPDAAGAFVATQMVNSYLPGEIGLANPGFLKYVDLYLASHLTSAGGIVHITSGYDCPDCGTLIVKSDTEVIGALATPEPATGGLMLLGLGMMIRKRFTQRRQLAAQVTHS